MQPKWRITKNEVTKVCNETGINFEKISCKMQMYVIKSSDWILKEMFKNSAKLQLKRLKTSSVVFSSRNFAVERGTCQEFCRKSSWFQLKFIYSEKTKKFCQIFTLLLSYVAPVKSKVKILQNFVAFSEYINFSTKFPYHSFKVDVGVKLEDF